MKKTNLQYEAFRAGFTSGWEMAKLGISYDLSDIYYDFIRSMRDDNKKINCGKLPIRVRAINTVTNKEYLLRSLQETVNFFGYFGTGDQFKKRYLNTGTHLAGLCKDWNLTEIRNYPRQVVITDSSGVVTRYATMQSACKAIGYKSITAIQYAIRKGIIQQGKFRNWKFELLEEK
tara:strand:+ start:2724 stop:3248 length:525 start_codon:yes stop_codon:yes gene_type:complete